mmetsp:Transcript_3693/g.6782  ORF Transcript_3693/g.6782 Transcript_3693/m.6782 type:complete len:565 (-) Transcript_3693:415-2109(-)
MMASAADIESVEVEAPSNSIQNPEQVVEPSSADAIYSDSDATNSDRSFMSRHKKAIALVSVSLAVVAAVAIGLSVTQSSEESASSATNGGGSDVIAKIKVDPESSEAEPISDFVGPLTDFIVTNPNVIRQSQFGAKECPQGEGLWNLVLITDNYPWETSWELLDADDALMASGPPAGTNYARTTRYTGNMCLPAGEYKMRWNDLTGDGICCDFGNGSWIVNVNGEDVAESDSNDDTYTTRDFPFEVIAASSLPTNPTAPSTTTKPTTTTTTAKTNPTISLDGEYCITVNIRTDNFGKKDTSWQLATKPTDGSDPQLLYSVEKGSLDDNTDYSNTFCVPEGTYTFTIFDDFGGLCCGYGSGFYAIKLDGEEIVYGTNFNTKNRTHDILAGFTPTTDARDLEWLDEHNIRREAYHNQNDVAFRRFVWARSLAQDAEAWADSIIASDECKANREQGIAEGENVSVRSANILRDDEEPANILSRWSDTKADKDWPANQSFTQVMWRATRYLGCADKSAQLSNGAYCYISICRYARAGNCNMGGYADKSIPVLLNRTACGPDCPEEGCY